MRGALYRADVDALVGLLVAGRDWPVDALQLLGEAVFVVGEHRHDIEPAARQCVRQLRDRDWEGDADLATQIEASFGWAPTLLLRWLPVDLEELAGVLEGDPLQGGGRIDLRTGEVWPQSVWDFAEETGDDDELVEENDDGHWMWVHCEGSRAGYRDMELFIDLVEDPHLADRLGWSIQGRGAFRRFKDVLADWPDLLERWYGFTDERHRGRARAWLAAEGYAPDPNHDRP